MKQSEKAAVQEFIIKRRAKIEAEHLLAREAARQRADLERETYLSEHKYTMIQDPLEVALQKFQEKIREGYELAGMRERFWPQITPDGFLSIPMIVPQKQLQKHADEVKQRVLDEQYAIAEADYKSALAGLETEVRAFLDDYRANAAEQADADAVRALLKCVEASDAD